MDHPSCTTGPAGQQLWLRMVIAVLKWFFSCAALTTYETTCASESDSITLTRPVSQHTLNAACLCVKVESIKILTESPALNWPCAAFASRRYNVISRDWTNMLSKISFSVRPKSPILSKIPSKFRISVQRYLTSFNVIANFGCRLRWHLCTIFDVPRASTTYGIIHDHNSPRSD